MKYCDICGESVFDEGHILFTGKDGKARFACPQCRKRLEQNDNNAKWYLKYISKNCRDEELLTFLAPFTDYSENSDEIKTISQSNPQHTAGTTTFSWAGFLRTVMYLFIFVGIIGSIAMSVPFFEDEEAGIGLVIVIGGSLLTLIAAAGVMVFLDMASDVRRIRENIERK